MSMCEMGQKSDRKSSPMANEIRHYEIQPQDFWLVEILGCNILTTVVTVPCGRVVSVKAVLKPTEAFLGHIILGDSDRSEFAGGSADASDIGNGMLTSKCIMLLSKQTLCINNTALSARMPVIRLTHYVLTLPMSKHHLG